MPAIGITDESSQEQTLNQGDPSVVKNPPSLPIAIAIGTLDWSVSFEGFPSGSINYEGITQNQIPQYEQSYRPGIRTVTLYGIKFIVDSYGYDREFHPNKEMPFDTFKVSIKLKSYWEDRVQKKIKVFSVVGRAARSVTLSALCRKVGVPYSGPVIKVEIPENSDANYELTIQDALGEKHRALGCYVSYTHGVVIKEFDAQARSWTFPKTQIITDGQNNRTIWNSFKDKEMTWGSDDKENTDIDPYKENDPKFTRKEPKIETIVEESDRPEEPPPNTHTIQTLDSTCDKSSPSKTRKITTQIDGTPEKEEIWTWKFCYTAADIWNESAGQFFTNQPAQYWMITEYQKVEYVYKELPEQVVNIKARDPNNQNQEISLIVNPEYKDFVTYSALGDRVVYKSNARYNTEVVTTGWKLLRLKQEDDSNMPTLDSEDPYYVLAKYKKVSMQARQAFLLKSKRADLGEEVGLPFSVEWKAYEELDTETKRLISRDNKTSDGKVGILTPDLNFIEPMYIKTETKVVNSLLWAPNPEADPEDPPTCQPLVTGEESYFELDRTIEKSGGKATGGYRERILESSFQDAGFATSAERISFREVLGAPPDASTRQQQWEIQEKPPEQEAESAPAKPKYYITSDLVNDLTPEGDSVSYADAKTLREALKMAELDLRIQDMEACQASRTVSWFFPEIDEGDIVSCGAERFDFGIWRVMGCSWKLEFDSSVPEAYCMAKDGTSLSLGLDHKRQITYKKKAGDTPADQQPSGDPTLSSDPTQSGSTLGLVLVNAPNRRKF